jgi:signal transduction histidine kinase
LSFIIRLDIDPLSIFAEPSFATLYPQLISGPLTDLEHGETDPKRITSFNMIQRNASRLIRLVDSLMDFSRIEGGRLMGRYSPVNLGEITSELADMFKPAIEKVSFPLLFFSLLTLLDFTTPPFRLPSTNQSRIQFFNRCDSGSAPGRVYVDIELWEKIVFNLLGNAYKYTLKGSIVVSVIYHPDEAEVSITDTGVGIPKADISKVTERFHRVASISRSHEGTGIGLALCAELIQLHGGRLNVSLLTRHLVPLSFPLPRASS